jgi:hypothetical protein
MRSPGRRGPGSARKRSTHFRTVRGQTPAAHAAACGVRIGVVAGEHPGVSPKVIEMRHDVQLLLHVRGTILAPLPFRGKRDKAHERRAGLTEREGLLEQAAEAVVGGFPHASKRPEETCTDIYRPTRPFIPRDLRPSPKIVVERQSAGPLRTRRQRLAAFGVSGVSCCSNWKGSATRRINAKGPAFAGPLLGQAVDVA